MVDTGYDAHFDYRVDIHRRRNRVTASLDGTEFARSERTLLVDEQDHGLVFYFPRDDVRMDLLEPVADYHTRCPWKGEASYWRVKGAEEPSVWSYDDPLPQVAQLKGHVGFYQNIFTVRLGVAKFLENWRAQLVKTAEG